MLHLLTAATSGHCLAMLKPWEKPTKQKIFEERPEQHKKAPINPRTLQRAACLVGQDKMASSLVRSSVPVAANCWPANSCFVPSRAATSAWQVG